MTSSSSPLATPFHKWLPYLSLTIIVFFAYSNIYDNALIFDDTIIIISNDFLKSWNSFGKLLLGSTIAGSHATGGFYRPLQMLLYFFIYRINGPDPIYFHLLNVVLHAANACLVFLLSRKLNFNIWASFLATLIWAVHPLQTEAISYASGTADPLMAFFCLLGVIIVVPRLSARRILFSIPFFILALLSKEGAVVFPALVMSCIFLLDENRLHPRTYLRSWPLWLIAIGYTWWRATAPGFDGPQSYDQFYAQHGFDNLQLYAGHFLYRFYTFLATLPAYLLLMVRPTGLHMERSFPVYVSMQPIETWMGVTMILGAAAQILWSSTRRGPKPGLPLSWGFLWFAAAHFPNTGLIVPMNSQFLEHWMYLPSVGLFLGASETLSARLDKIRWKRARSMAAFAMVIIAALLMLRTFEQNFIWRDPFTFYGNIFKYGEVSPRARNNLALAYMDEGDYPAAVTEFQKAITRDDAYAETRYNLALAFLRLPNPDAHVPEAIASLNRSIELDPTFYRAWETLAAIYDHLGDTGKASNARAKAKEAYNALR